MIVFFILGSVCSGKTSLINKFNVKTVSIGKILRKLSETDEKIKESIIKGEFLSEDYISELFSKTIHSFDLKNDIIFVDGYPRKIEQLEFVKKLVSEKETSFVTIYLSVKENKLEERYKIRSNSENRLDDNYKIFKKRSEHFFNTYEEILSFLSLNMRTYIVDANSELDSITDYVSEILKSYTSKKDILKKNIS